MSLITREEEKAEAEKQYSRYKSGERQGTTVVVKGPFCWGAGSTLVEAIDRCKKHWPGGARKFKLSSCHIRVVNDKEAWLDDMGTLNYYGDMNITIQIPVKEKEKK